MKEENEEMEDALNRSLDEELNLDELSSLEGGVMNFKEQEQITNAVANCASNNCNGGNCASGCGK